MKDLEASRRVFDLIVNHLVREANGMHPASVPSWSTSFSRHRRAEDSLIAMANHWNDTNRACRFDLEIAMCASALGFNPLGSGGDVYAPESDPQDEPEETGSEEAEPSEFDLCAND